MGKINFTKEHFEKLETLAVEMLFNNDSITTKLGQPLNIVELIHTTTINTLNSIRLSIAKSIENLENQDEWVASSSSQSMLEDLKSKKELVNLIIGYKRWKIEKVETERQRSELNEQLKALKESQKTPEDKIKEIEDKLKSLDSEEF